MTPPQVEETQPEQRTPPIQPPASTQKLDEKGSQEERSDQASARDGQDTAVATGAGSTPAKSFAGNSNREGQTARHEGSTSEYTEQEPGQSSIQDAGNDDLLGSLNENTAGLSLEEPLRPDPSVGTTAVAKSPSPPPPPPKDEKFLESVSDEAPSKPLPRNPPPLDTSQNTWSTKGTKDEMAPDESAEMLDDSRSEIQSIIDQFEEGGMGEQEIMSPRLEKAGPLLSSPSFFPPRRSSLEPINSGTQLSQVHSNQSGASIPDNLPPRSSSLLSGAHMSEKSPEPSPEPPPKIYKPPVPLPEPEPDLPFDFHRFLEQLRHRTADPVAKFLRSFLNEFGKKQWMVHEQVKIVSDFLEFISKKMAQCEVWRAVSDAEFDNAREGMEKLVMNRLYSQCFSPAIPSPEPTSDSKGKRKGGAVPLAPGRRGQHQEDVERDEILAQKVRIYGWVKEEHLDIKTVGDKGRKFLKLAQQGVYLFPGHSM